MKQLTSHYLLISDMIMIWQNNSNIKNIYINKKRHINMDIHQL